MRYAATVTLTATLLCGGASAESADYRLVFEATWTDPAVPGEHFSGLVGGTHNDSIAFWSVGDLATLGIKRMAELGSKSILIGEVNEQITNGAAASVICGSGAVSPGSTSITFTVDEDHPLVTVVTMIAPSPDWFAGVSGLALHDGTEWISSLAIDLHPYDAGTDSGMFFTSPNAPTTPPDAISLIEDDTLFDPAVVGTFRFQRLTDCNDNGQFDIDEIAADPSLDHDGDGLLDACECPADILGEDHVVDTTDLLVLLANWGTDGLGAAIAEPNDTADIADMLSLLASWGRCP